MRSGNGHQPPLGQLKSSGTGGERSSLRVWYAEIIILIESALRNETLKSIRTVATINVTALKDALTCLDWGSGKWRRGIARSYSILTAGSLQLRVSVFGVKVFLACQNAEVTPPTQFAHSQGQPTHTQSSTLISAHTRTLLGTHTHTHTSTLRSPRAPC